MCKLIRRLICLSVFALSAFIAISLYSGGKGFRWFGEKVEKYHERAVEKAEQIGKSADKLKGKADTLKEIKNKLIGKKTEEARKSAEAAKEMKKIRREAGEEENGESH